MSRDTPSVTDTIPPHPDGPTCEPNPGPCASWTCWQQTLRTCSLAASATRCPERWRRYATISMWLGLQPKSGNRTRLPLFTHLADSMRRSVSMPASPAQHGRVESASRVPVLFSASGQDCGKPLTEPECERLVELESVLDRDLKSFVAVGLALKEIRDSRLYRKQYKTFEGYCRQRWALGRNYVNKKIQATEIVRELPVGTVVPTNEAQTRELARLKTPEERRKVWGAVTAPGAPPPTAKQIRKAILEEKNREANGKSDKESDNDPNNEPEGLKYILRATVTITPDADPRELEELIRMRQVHWVLKNGHNKTLAFVRVETIESLERLP